MPVYPRDTATKGTVYDVVLHSAGKTIWRRGFATERLAKDSETKLKASILLGQPAANERITLADYIEQRFLPAKRDTLKKHSYDEYKSHLKYAVQFFKTQRLARITVEDMKRFMRSLSTRQLGSTTRATILTRVRAVFHEAMKEELIYRNVASLVDTPRRQRYQARVLSIEELQRLITAATKHDLGALVYLAVVTGMRWGELAGLDWQDIDEAEGFLRIGEAKTPSGVRSVAIGPRVLDALRLHRLEQRTQWLEWGLQWSLEVPIFQTTQGNRLKPSAFWYRWNETRREAGLEGLRFHDLRHVHSTLLAKAGVHPRVMQDRLGHATAKMSLEVYTAVGAEDQRPGALAVEALFRA